MWAESTLLASMQTWLHTYIGNPVTILCLIHVQLITGTCMLGQYYCFCKKILLNKAIYNCSFANLSSIFSIFGILVNNGIVDKSNDFRFHGNHFGGKICVTIVTKMCILLNLISQAEYRVYNTVWYIIGKLIPSACQWCLRNVDTVYIK